MAKRAIASKIDDVPLLERTRAVAISAGSATTLAWTMLDDAGLPINLTDLAAREDSNRWSPLLPFPLQAPGDIPVSAAMRLCEAVAGSSGDGVISATGSVVDAAAGEVSVTLDGRTQLKPAIYTADVAALVADVPVVINRLLVYCEPSLFAVSADGEGPPPRSEVRLRLRDSSPAENRLFDELQFDDAEIAQALLSVVRYWNTASPPVSPFTTANFPFRHQWIEGACALLYRSAAAWYRKNKLTTQAGGVALNDMDKADEFDRLSAALWGEFARWVVETKVAINMSLGFGSTGSPYGLVSRALGVGRGYW